MKAQQTLHLRYVSENIMNMAVHGCKYNHFVYEYEQWHYLYHSFVYPWDFKQYCEYAIKHLMNKKQIM